jgi:pimeloyl-ACP methyl ester carboxylesterase
MPYVTHKSGQKTFYYDDDFANPWEPHDTILIHHGFGRSSAFWYQWVPVLATKYRVIRRDALGHGHSSEAPDEGHPLTTNALLDEIIDTLDQLKLEKVHFLGESTGGIFGELLVARNPDRFLSLTICGSPLNYGPAGQMFLSFGYPGVLEALQGLGVRSWGEHCMKAIGTSNFTTPAQAKWWIDTFAIATTQGVVDYGRVICRTDFDATPILSHIKVPFLSLAPSDSGLVDLDDQRKLNHSVAGARLVIVPSHAHEIYLAEPKICQEEYLKFLAEMGQ